MTTTSGGLLAIAVAAVAAPNATDAGDQVFSPGDWPTQSGQYSRLKARVATESKQSLGRGGGPEFTVTATFRFIGEVSAAPQFLNAGANAAAAQILHLARQVEVAVIGLPALYDERVQQFPTVQTEFSYNSDGETHLAGFQMDVAVEFYQGPEDFAQPVTTDLNEVVAAWPAYPPTGFIANLT
ncbi:hypothetical protein [Sphingomonas sp. UYP23]